MCSLISVVAVHGLSMSSDLAAAATQCPVFRKPRTGVGTLANQHWWPDALNLRILRQNNVEADPMGAQFSYGKEFSKLDVAALTRDMDALMTDSQPWWPADFGHYGPFFIRLSWHSAGTYRVADGRGGGGSGAQRFAPLNSWPDNANLDKARRLLWPIKQKYGAKISWADLILFAGTRAMETMGLSQFGFAFGRPDIWAPEEDVYWGPEGKWLDDQRYEGDRQLHNPLGASQMGLIYVNPEGPNGDPDPQLAAHDIRETFGRMAMGDEETVALIAGGHCYGKMHGAAEQKYVGPEPEGAPIEQQQLGYKNSFGTGIGKDAIGAGLEGVWTENPTKWDNSYLTNLFKYEWECYTGPGGAKQWRPKGGAGEGTVPDAHDASKKHAPFMATTDLALIIDPAYRKISERFYKDLDYFSECYRRAWFKLLHRDMGPKARYLGPMVPDEDLLWQDPLPPPTAPPNPSPAQISSTKKIILSESGLTGTQLIATAWASASWYRTTDKRGGANGARIRLSPVRDWAINQASGVAESLAALERVQQKMPVTMSLADVIVLGGCAAIEQAAAAGGFSVEVPFTPGRVDASKQMTDEAGIAPLESKADGFRNYLAADAPPQLRAEDHLVDKAFMLTLTAPEMTVLLGGLRALGANAKGSQHGVLTARPGTLTPDFFTNLLDMRTQWKKSDSDANVYEGYDSETGETKWTATRVDLIFGSNSELRAIAEVYASDDAKAKFVGDFVSAWCKVMDVDRFDVRMREISSFVGGAKTSADCGCSVS
jgi:catalase-peroxidase